MVGRILSHFRSPFVVAAALCAVLLYAGGVPVRERHPYRSAVARGCLRSAAGTVAASPVRGSSGRFYAARLRLEHVTGAAPRGGAEVSAGAAGELAVLIPASIVESLYPGRLYSASRSGGVLVECGERLALAGRWSPGAGAFVAEEAEYLGPGGGLLGRLRHARALCRLSFRRLLFSWAGAGGLILALLAGSREYAEASVGESFRRAGLSHVLALSGMHLSLFAGLAGGAGRAALGRRAAPFFRLAGILFFTWFAGLSPSLFRALLCSLILLAAGGTFCRSADMLEVLCGAFLLHAAAFPQDVSSAPFLLSYGALAGVLLAGAALEPPLCRLVPPPLAGQLSASLGAQAATAPVCARLFGTVTPVGVIASVVVSPLAGLFLSLAVACVAASLLVPAAAPACGAVLNALYRVIAWAAAAFACVPPLRV